jgi:hypothetical protein
MTSKRLPSDIDGRVLQVMEIVVIKKIIEEVY